MTDKQSVFITEEMVERYHHLSKQAKEIDKELTRLKKFFNVYFDATVGPEESGEKQFQQFVLKRQIRKSEKWHPDVVQKLEELQLNDCIIVEKRPDEEKIKAALQLGFLSDEDLEEFRQRKFSKVIYVQEL